MDSIGLDLGTGAIKAVRLRGGCEIIGKCARKVEIFSPAPGQKEFDAERYFSLVLEIIYELSALSSEPVEAISWDAAAGNTLLCDSDAHPLTPVISWLDTRLDDWLPPEEWNVREITGWPRLSTFPLMHLEYFRRFSPEILKKSQITMHNEWLSRRLTGKSALDYSSATPFYLVNQCLKRYEKKYLDYYGISESQLPPLVATGAVIGTLRKEFAQGSLSERTRIIAGSFDHPSGARAAGITHPGELLLSFGTSWVGFYPVKNREEIPFKELSDPFQSASGGCWGGMFSVAGIGLKVSEFVQKRYGNSQNPYDIFNEEALDESTPAAHLMLEVIGRFRQKLGNRKFSRAVMIGGPSEGAAWKKYLIRELNFPIELSPYASYTCAAGAAKLAAGQEI